MPLYGLKVSGTLFTWASFVTGSDIYRGRLNIPFCTRRETAYVSGLLNSGFWLAHTHLFQLI